MPADFWTFRLLDFTGSGCSRTRTSAVVIPFALILAAVDVPGSLLYLPPDALPPRITTLLDGTVVPDSSA